MSIEHLTDLQVVNNLTEAHAAYEEAVIYEAQTEVQAQCVADVLVWSQELTRRGLVLGTLH